MVQRKEKDEIHWSTCAVLLAFCIKKQKMMQQNKPRDQTIYKTKHNKTTTKTKQTHIARSESQQQYTPTDKWIRGLGVSLAKTPLERITLKAGTPSHFFFLCVLCFCVVVVQCDHGRAVKPLMLLFVFFFIECVYYYFYESENKEHTTIDMDSLYGACVDGRVIQLTRRGSSVSTIIATDNGPV